MIEATSTASVCQVESSQDGRAASQRLAWLWALGAVASFHAAYLLSGYWIFAYLFCLLRVALTAGNRGSLRIGLAIGFLSVAPQLYCFWAIFGVGAIALWFVVAFWIGLFVWLSHLGLARFGVRWGGLLAPILWIGLEYFRSELYYLKFSWLNVGYAFAGTAVQPLFKWTGIYGLGFISAAAAMLVAALPPKRAMFMALRVALAGIVLLFALAYLRTGRVPVGRPLTVAGLQLEFPTEKEILTGLDRLKDSKAELLVLSEYTLDGPVPESIRQWCREHRQYLVIGGKAPASGSNFYDTAFVVGSTGETVFQQGKCVPIQFFNDGLPATEQRVWESPWGKIGFCVCYDLSYSRVTDRLIRLGAQAIIVPTMDVIGWGEWEHRLHARVGPVRAAEHGIPIVRLASSGISQILDETGTERARAGFPGQREVLSGTVLLAGPGGVPWDRWIGLSGAGVAGAWLILATLGRKWLPRPATVVEA